MSLPRGTERYRAGKVPVYSNEEEVQSNVILTAIVDTQSKKDADREKSARKQVAKVVEQIKDTKQKHVVAEVIVSQDKSHTEEEEEDEEEHDRRRARLRERALSKQQETVVAEEVTINIPEEKSESSDEESEEEEEDEDEDEESEEEITRPHIAPVFKTKRERDTLAEQIRTEEEQEAEQRSKIKRLEERKLETKEILQQEIKKNIEEQNAPPVSLGEKDDLNVEEEDENVNQAEEYEAWKLRELARIKREQLEREQATKERDEIERRRKLTDNEILNEDKDFLKPKEKKKMKYLQKYYHAGAFYRSFDDTDIKEKWDFTSPTLEDHVDKTLLPSVMQVKNFGRAGRTKYTHLVDQDTTNWESPWFQKDNTKGNYKQKLGGLGPVNTKKT